MVKLGPLEVNSQENHTVWIPTAAGVVAVLAGVGLVFAGKKSRLSILRLQGIRWRVAKAAGATIRERSGVAGCHSSCLSFSP